VKPLVVIAYDDYADLSVETGLLAAAGADVAQCLDLEAPDSAGLLARAAALMVTIRPVPAGVVAQLEQCRIISRVGTGLDAIDIPAATAAGIWVSNVPDYAVDEVSTHAITLLLSLARRVPQLVYDTRRGLWNGRAVMPFPRLRGLVLGTLGFGRIAQATIAKAQGLGLSVLVHDPYVDPARILAAGCEPVDWPTLLRRADFISLHSPLTPETRNIVNAEALALVKPNAYLINTARGALIDEPALLAAVKSGRLAGAALDVLGVEPPAPEDALLHDDRILITPHMGWYSEDAMLEMRVQGCDNVLRVLRGEPPRTPANQITVARL
jgi:D-3-phosphoglycerate dehydrogenase / 2-oxoglutarate reductase